MQCYYAPADIGGNELVARLDLWCITIKYHLGRAFAIGSISTRKDELADLKDELGDLKSGEADLKGDTNLRMEIHISKRGRQKG